MVVLSSVLFCIFSLLLNILLIKALGELFLVKVVDQ